MSRFTSIVAGSSAASLLAAAVVAPTLAFAQIGVGEVIGKTEAEIREAVTAKGYQIIEFEREHDEIEVEGILNGKTYEIELDPQTGAVRSVELED